MSSFLTPHQIAEQYAFERASVYHWIEHGVSVSGLTVRLYAIRIGRSWRIPSEAWESFMAACNPERPVPATRSKQVAEAAASRRVRKRLGLE